MIAPGILSTAFGLRVPVTTTSSSRSCSGPARSSWPARMTGGATSGCQQRCDDRGGKCLSCCHDCPYAPRDGTACTRRRSRCASVMSRGATEYKPLRGYVQTKLVFACVASATAARSARPACALSCRAQLTSRTRTLERDHTMPMRRGSTVRGSGHAHQLQAFRPGPRPVRHQRHAEPAIHHHRDRVQRVQLEALARHDAGLRRYSSAWRPPHWLRS